MSDKPATDEERGRWADDARLGFVRPAKEPYVRDKTVVAKVLALDARIEAERLRADSNEALYFEAMEERDRLRQDLRDHNEECERHCEGKRERDENLILRRDLGQMTVDLVKWREQAIADAKTIAALEADRTMLRQRLFPHAWNADGTPKETKP